MAKYSYIALKEKDGVLRFSDAPTAALKGSDFRRLSTNRVVAEAIDMIREVATPYIGEGGSPQAIISLETNCRKELSKLQTLGKFTRFQIKIHASLRDRIEGNATAELVLVPSHELRKIRVVTALAKQ